MVDNKVEMQAWSKHNRNQSRTQRKCGSKHGGTQSNLVKLKKWDAHDLRQKSDRAGPDWL